MIRPLLCFVLCVAAAAQAVAAPATAQILAFKQHNACPSTGERGGACPGYEVAFVIPPCFGGPDLEYNLQWLSTEEHRDKTQAELKMCPASGTELAS